MISVISVTVTLLTLTLPPPPPPGSLRGCRNEYLIFQKITKLEYEFPEKFFPKAKDLVQRLLVGHVL